MSTVLVVEDDAPMRFLILHQLEGRGHRIIEADDGAHGLELAAEIQPDIVVTDLAMPRMSGGELVQALRDGDYGGKPIVVFTGLSMNDPQVAAIEDPSVCILHKPADLSIVATVVNQMLMEHRSDSARPMAG